MPKKQFKIKPMLIDDLLKYIVKNKVAIPEFQRGYVWDKHKVKNLFDSLINQYPIGVFTIWNTSKDIDPRDMFGVEPKKHGRKYLILDGQQRLLTLYFLCNKERFSGKVLELFQEYNESKKLVDFRKFYYNSGKKKGGIELLEGDMYKIKFDEADFKKE